MKNDSFLQHVRWAEGLLRDQFEVMEEIRGAIGWTDQDERVLDNLTRLETAREENALSARQIALEQVSLDLCDIEDAFRQGLAPEGKFPTERNPYLRLLKELAETSCHEAASFDAMVIHATQYLNYAESMPVEIRRFVIACLNGELNRPIKRGPHTKGTLMNGLIYDVVVDLVDRFDLKPTHNEAAEEGKSACWVVAKAMVNLRARPQSYQSIKRIYFLENAERKRAQVRTMWAEVGQ